MVKAKKMSLSDFHQKADDGDKKKSWADDDVEDFQPQALRTDSEQPKQPYNNRRDQQQQPRDQQPQSAESAQSDWRTQSHRPTGAGRRDNFNRDENRDNYEPRNNNNNEEGGFRRRDNYNRDENREQRPRGEFQNRGGFRGNQGEENGDRAPRQNSQADVDDDWRKRDPETAPQPSQSSWGKRDNERQGDSQPREFRERREHREPRAPREPRQQHPIPTEAPFIAYVGNLDYGTQEEDLQNFFKLCNLKEIRIARNPDRTPKGFAYAEFNDVEGLKEALSYTGADFLDRKILIDVAEKRKSQGEREDRKPSRYGFNKDSKDTRTFERRDASHPQESAQATTAAPAATSSGPKKSNPFGDAKPVDQTLALKKIDAKLQQEREELNKKLEEEKARKEAEAAKQPQSSDNTNEKRDNRPRNDNKRDNNNTRQPEQKRTNDTKSGDNKKPQHREKTNTFAALSAEQNN